MIGTPTTACTENTTMTVIPTLPMGDNTTRESKIMKEKEELNASTAKDETKEDQPKKEEMSRKFVDTFPDNKRFARKPGGKEAIREVRILLKPIQFHLFFVTYA